MNKFLIWNSISFIEFNQTSIQNDGSTLLGRPFNLLVAKLRVNLRGSSNRLWSNLIAIRQVSCLVPRPHFSSEPKRFGSRGSCENVRPRQKSSKVRQKWDRSMAMVNKTSLSNFKVKNTSLKHTDGKGIFKRILSFLQVDKERLFRLYKIITADRSALICLFWNATK